MDINKTLQELKARPGFTEHVGMMLVHNGVVRGWSRKDHAPVSAVRVSHDNEKMREICREMEQRPGIFAIVAQAEEGLLKPGDDLLFLVGPGISASMSKRPSPNCWTGSRPKPSSSRSTTRPETGASSPLPVLSDGCARRLAG